MGSAFDSVGTLLADMANLLGEGLRILGHSDKRHWGQDEHEQVHALEQALDEAKKDYQELCPLVNGQAQYRHDRNHETVGELRALRTEFQAHMQLLRDWSQSGGPINPIWVRETHSLQRELHRAQRRAARRIYSSSQESSQRCLGAFLVRRAQRNLAARPADALSPRDCAKRQLEELAACSQVGSFDRFGEDDVAFVCDFCDGHMVWADLETVPAERTRPYVPAPRANDPHWRAAGRASSTAKDKHVVFAPLVVASHMEPLRGDWQARLLCPFCDEDAQRPRDHDDEDDLRKPQGEFDDVAALQEHLEWQHAAGGLSAIAGASTALPSKDGGCLVM
ncbi:uncharacterized protein UV8b_06755 [Ustilaginoidea virens]|uniref:Uncharacterized protein n=1 Tax=Ustilaginoidea virens TaxID=1159556 RepID=A0A8E5HWH1_USTVR|nr:uncharacterized protein UV8b_06755 [Ustilaginoidea virens]QUC22514.1 hypothetical protein UV8b_06755 [Ustilaginoidea virens]